ncbi:DUF1643 domain-containing protein [Citrobacter bitternis]|uniref:DUF1643 domain-containing protein n=1 Tax=Citrobacter bitternis TaxID=1585982 RepID=A0ABW1Q122_9ENTR
MTAIFSDCGNYRYRLERVIDATGEGKVFAFLGINPSTADAKTDDATISKMTGLATRTGAGRIIVGNVFSLISTDINGLRKGLPLRGNEHDKHFQQIIKDADILIPCWGSRNKLAPEFRISLDECMEILLGSKKPFLCFGKTKGTGDPCHPGRLPYSTKIIEWVPACQSGI